MNKGIKNNNGNTLSHEERIEGIIIKVQENKDDFTNEEKKYLLNHLEKQKRLGLSLHFSDIPELLRFKDTNGKVKKENFKTILDKYLVFFKEREAIKSLEFNNHDEEKQSHLLIEGENYLALKALLATNLRVDVIYIDPPYNTGNAFVYNDRFVSNEDRFKHSKWLSFMEKRLRIAKKLLNDDGIIFISVDDNEQAYLKVKMDEIFGENSFVTTIVWKSSGGGKNDDKRIPQNKEYILCYSNRKNFSKSPNFNKEKLKMYDKNDPNCRKYGKYKLGQLCWASLTYEKKLDYVLYVDRNGEIEFDKPANPDDYMAIYSGSLKLTNDERKKLWEKRHTGIHNKKDWCWFWSKDTMKAALRKGFLEVAGFPKETMTIKQKKYENAFFSGKECKIIEKENIYAYELMRDLLDFKQWATKEGNHPKKVNTKLGGEQLKEIFGRQVFTYPKPVELIQKLIMCHGNKNALVLDFFAGTGTTGHAVMKLNLEDGGNRRCILITNNEMFHNKKNEQKEDFYLNNSKPYIVDTIKYPSEGIARAITWERIHVLLKGKLRNEESIKIEPYKNESWKYLTLEYFLNNIDSENEYEDILDDFKKLYSEEFGSAKDNVKVRILKKEWP